MHSEMLETISERQRIFWLTGLLLFCVAAHSPALWNGFVWDDEYVVVRNESIRDLDRIPDFFVDISTSASATGESLLFYRPLRTLSHALIFAVWELSPVPYHALNLIIHLLTVWTVWRLLERLEWNPVAVIFGTAVFAIHPLTTEPVGNVSSLADLLCTLFVLSAFSASLNFLLSSRASWWEAGRATFWYACALLSKESAVIFPGLVILLLLVKWKQIHSDKAMSRAVGFVAISAMLTAGYWILRFGLGAALPEAEYAGATLGRTMLMQAIVMVRYVSLIVWPAGLTIRHDVPVPMDLTDVLPWAAVASWVAAIGVGLLAWLAGRWRLALGIGWFFIALGPVMNVVPLPGSMMGERFLYPALFGVILVLLCCVGPMFRTRWGPTLGLFVLLALGSRSFVRQMEWRDNLSIFESAVRVAPASNAIRINLVREYERLGEMTKSREHFEAAVQNTQRYYRQYLTIALKSEERGRDAEALLWFTRALRMNPQGDEARSGLERVRRRVETGD